MGRGHCGGRGGGRTGGWDAGRVTGGWGQEYNAKPNKPTMVGLCKDLEGNIFDFGMKNGADLMPTTQEKIVQYIKTKFGMDIVNKIQNRVPFTIPPATSLPAILKRHAVREAVVWTQQNNLLTAFNAQKVVIEAQIAAMPMDLDLHMSLAWINNEIAVIQYKSTQPVEVQLMEQEKTQYCSEAKSYTKQVNKLEVHHGQVYSLILGQCTQLLQDKIKQESSWISVSQSYDQLKLLNVIEKVILKQMDDKYPFAMVHE